MAKIDYSEGNTTSTRRILIVRKTVMIMNSRSGKNVDVEHKFHIDKQSFFRWSKRVSEKIPIMNSTRD